ncbi:hypothetical protein [Brevibacillus porteri]|uniref:hypothetical protein n=1 Tax=Brevibacillus porteri TaxID=2126350 RepID=UPI003D20C6A6
MANERNDPEKGADKDKLYADEIKIEAEKVEMKVEKFTVPSESGSTNCFQDLRKKLKRLQGSVFRVDKGSVILTGDFGTRMIPICAISSIYTCRVYAYVTNSGTLDNLGNNVSVINTITNTIITSIPVGNLPNAVAVGQVCSMI